MFDMARMPAGLLPVAWISGMINRLQRNRVLETDSCPPSVRWLRKEAAGFRRLAKTARDADETDVYLALAEALEARANSIRNG